MKRKSPHQFATGLCAKILVERKIRGGEMRTYFCPAFCVSHKGKDKAYRIPKLGFSGAWSKAVNYFVENRDLNGNNALSLLARKPEKSIFTGSLLKKTQSRCHKLTSRRIKEMLDAEFE